LPALDARVSASAAAFCYKNAMNPSLSLSYVSLGVADPAESSRFYREVMGLLEVGEKGDRLLLGHGTGHHYLELRPGDGVHHFGLELRGDDLRGLARRLRGRGVGLESAAGNSEEVWVRDPDGNLLTVHGPIDRSGQIVADGAGRPQRADHITFGSPDVEAMVDFYVNALGFKVSDRMEDDFVWMRGDRHHHTVAVVRSPEPELDHYSVEICSWENIKTWCDRFAALGVPVAWGPGRHGPGNNLFVFVDDPDGRHIELSTEMEQFHDDLVDYGVASRVWRRSSAPANLWGPLPTWREVITGSR
jgi:catechol 2,3-dioxygenase